MLKQLQNKRGLVNTEYIYQAKLNLAHSNNSFSWVEPTKFSNWNLGNGVIQTSKIINR